MIKSIRNVKEKARAGTGASIQGSSNIRAVSSGHGSQRWQQMLDIHRTSLTFELLTV